ncbi:hypothetical protein [Rubellicoccus peritrichatus]|uniref:Uncharacterized protein n=1 Tax=Rubellicoccus peritrichatus TaxID=3080537 RepID=A0AAQ3QWM2_9BACT|nr:hypothetical protein [Puniceicoccus sp. CR14]WOO42000.1 hypothetical protein RZN69_02790 [Puniceicoccus sp. CR14]
MMKLRFALITAAMTALFLTGCFTSEETATVPQPTLSTEVATETSTEELPEKIERMSTITVLPAKEAQTPAQGESVIQVRAAETEPTVETIEEVSVIAVAPPKPEPVEKPTLAKVTVAPPKQEKAPKAMAAASNSVAKPSKPAIPTKPKEESVSISIGSKVNMSSYYEKQLARDDLSPELKAYYSRKLAEAKADE